MRIVLASFEPTVAQLFRNLVKYHLIYINELIIQIHQNIVSANKITRESTFVADIWYSQVVRAELTVIDGMFKGKVKSPQCYEVPVKHTFIFSERVESKESKVSKSRV